MQVQLPNGDIAEFPDDMPHADIEAVLQKQFGAPSTASDLAKSALSGIGIGGGTIVDALNPFNMARDLGGNASALMTGDFSTAAPVRGPSAPASAAMSSLYTPQTRLGHDIQSGTAGATMGVIGGPGGMISGLTGGVGGSEGGQIAADTLGEGARPYGGLIGSLIGSGIGSRAYNAASNALTDPVGTARASTKAAKDAAYQAVDQSQETISKPGVQRFVSGVREDLKRNGYVESAPEYASITRKLAELETKPASDLTPAGFDAYMKGLDNIASGNSEASGLAKFLKRKVTGFLDSVDSTTIRDARSANRDYEAFNLADNVEQGIARRAPGTSKQTASRNAFGSIANDEDQMAYLRPDQRALVDRAATTTTGERALREVAKLSPNRLLGFGASGAAVGTAAAGAFNPMFLAPNALGIAAELGYRGSVNGTTAKAIQGLRRMTPQPGYTGFGGTVGAAANQRPARLPGILQYLFQ